MAYTRRKYSNSEVDNAGLVVIKPIQLFSDEYDKAKGIIDNWRAAHNLPLIVFRMGLSKKVKVAGGGIVAQRIKRFRAIKTKLPRLLDSPKYKDIKLSDFQDIGGCRAVLENVKIAEGVVKVFKARRTEHFLVRENNYIDKPKSSTGYRSHHLIYRYKTKNKKLKSYNNLQIEVQIRSKLQHIWATAVESVDTFHREKLKTNRGDKGWTNFFKLMSSYFAFMEDRPIVPGTPKSMDELKKQIRKYVSDLDIENRLKNLKIYGEAIDTVWKQLSNKKPLIILKLDTHDKERPKLSISAFPESDQKRAEELLSEIEREAEKNEFLDSVLIRVDDVDSLKSAYPNYFLDVGEFMGHVKGAVS